MKSLINCQNRSSNAFQRVCYVIQEAAYVSKNGSTVEAACGSENSPESRL
jgi:hypothetical protein